MNIKQSSKILKISNTLGLLFILNCSPEKIIQQVPYTNSFVGNWEHFECIYGCLGGSNVYLKLTSDSVYSKEYHITDLVPFPTCSRYYGGWKNAKGIWWANADSIKFETVLTDSLYNTISDTCQSGTFIIKNMFKYYFKNDSLFIAKSGITGTGNDMGFKKQ